MGIIGIDAVAIIIWPRSRRAGGGISLTRAGFMLIAPPFVNALRAAEARIETWLTYRHEEDSKPRIQIYQKFSDYAKR